MTDKEIRAELEALLMSDEMFEIAKRGLIQYFKDQELYGGVFQPLIIPPIQDEEEFWCRMKRSFK